MFLIFQIALLMVVWSLDHLWKELYIRHVQYIQNLTTTVNSKSKPVLFRLQQSPVNSYLHVKSNLGVHQVLILLLMTPQLIKQLINLPVLGSNLTIRIDKSQS